MAETWGVVALVIMATWTRGVSEWMQRKSGLEQGTHFTCIYGVHESVIQHLCNESLQNEAAAVHGVKMVARQNTGAILIRNTHKYLGQHKGYRLVMVVRRPPSFTKTLPVPRSLCEQAMGQVPTGENNSFCTSMQPIFKSIDKTTIDLGNRIREVDNDIEILLKGGLQLRSKRTRAPLEIVGEFSKTVFGTALEREVTQLQDMARQVHRYMSDVSNYTGAVRNITVHFMNATASKLDGLSGDLLTQASYIKHVAMATEDTKRTLASVGRAAVQEEWWIKYIMAILSSKLLHSQTLANYLAHKRELVASLETLRAGRISTGIVPIRQMKESILEVGRQVRHKGYRLATRNIGFYYDDFLSAYTFTEKHIYMNFHVPIMRTRSSFEVFRIKSFPVPINAREHVGYTQLSQLPDYILVDRVKRQYIETSKEDMEECVSGHLLLCPVPFASHSFSNPSCALGLYLNDRVMTSAKCRHVVSPGAPMPAMLLPAGDSSVIASHGKGEAILACQNNKTTLEPCSLCSYDIPCNCTLSLDNVFLDGMDPQCMLDTLTVSYAINLPVIDALNISLGNATPAVTFTTPLDIMIPNISSYIKRITQSYGSGYAVDLSRYAADLKGLSIPEQSNSMTLPNLHDYDSRTVQTALPLVFSVLAAILAGVALYRTNRLLGIAAYAAPVRGDRIQLSPAVPTLPVFPSLRLKQPTANIQDMIAAMTYQEKIMTSVLMIILLYVLAKVTKAIMHCLVKACCRVMQCWPRGLKILGGREAKKVTWTTTEVLLKVQSGARVEVLKMGRIFDDIGVLESVVVLHIWVAYVDVYCLSSVFCLSSALTIEYKVGRADKRFEGGDRIWASRPQGTHMRSALTRRRDLGAGEVAIVLQQGERRRQLVHNGRPRTGEEGTRDRPFAQGNAAEFQSGGRVDRLYPMPPPSSPELNRDPEEGARLMEQHYRFDHAGLGLTPPPPPKYNLEP